MAAYYFTFGSGHLDSNGNSLGGNFCKVEARNLNEARAVMFLLRGPKWSHNYNEKQIKASAEKFNLEPVSLDLIPLTEEQSPRGFDGVDFVREEVQS